MTAWDIFKIIYSKNFLSKKKDMFSPPALPNFSTAKNIITRKQLQGKIAELLLAQKPAAPASQDPESSRVQALCICSKPDSYRGSPPLHLNVFAYRYVYSLSWTVCERNSGWGLGFIKRPGKPWPYYSRRPPFPDSFPCPPWDVQWTDNRVPHKNSMVWGANMGGGNQAHQGDAFICRWTKTGPLQILVSLPPDRCRRRQD